MSNPVGPPPLPTQKKDRLAECAVWAVAFTSLSLTVVGGAVGGLLAGLIAWPLVHNLPVREDGRKIPVWLSILLIIGAIAVLIIGTVAFAKARNQISPRQISLERASRRRNVMKRASRELSFGTRILGSQTLKAQF